MKPFQFSNQLHFMLLEEERSRLGVGRKNEKGCKWGSFVGLVTTDILDLGRDWEESTRINSSRPRFGPDYSGRKIISPRFLPAAPATYRTTRTLSSLSDLVLALTK
jgi:hypothetical protein